MEERKSAWEWGGRGGIAIGLIVAIMLIYFQDIVAAVAIPLAGTLLFFVVRQWPHNSTADKRRRTRYLIGIIVGSLILEVIPVSRLVWPQSEAKRARIPEQEGKVSELTPQSPAPQQPLAPQPRPKRRLGTLFYGEDKLNGRRIPLARGCHPSACVTMHVWPWPNPDSFGLYGVWMHRPESRVSPFENGRVFLEFSEEVSPKSGSAGCQPSPEKPRLGYKVSLICGGSPTIGQTRWTLPFLNFVPVRQYPVDVWMKFEYGDVQTEAAAFTLLPPD